MIKREIMVTKQEKKAWHDLLSTLTTTKQLKAFMVLEGERVTRKLKTTHNIVYKNKKVSKK